MFSKYKKLIFLFIIILFFYSVFLCGRFGYFYQLQISKPEIVEMEEINPKVCRVWIDDFGKTQIKGHINFLNARLSYKDKIFLVNDNGEFEITK